MTTLRSLEEYIERQQKWSADTFGPGTRAKGIVQHLRKELEEVEAQPDDVFEWCDLVILALDGAWRAGYRPAQIVQALLDKQQKNLAREWPDWRERSQDEAIEHDRTHDEVSDQREAAGEVVAFLNDLLALDREAVEALVRHRVPCNQALTEHPTVQVGPIAENGQNHVGLLGLLNGLIGIDSSGWGYVAAEFDVPEATVQSTANAPLLNSRIRRFVLLPESKHIATEAKMTEVSPDGPLTFEDVADAAARQQAETTRESLRQRGEVRTVPLAEETAAYVGPGVNTERAWLLWNDKQSCPVCWEPLDPPDHPCENAWHCEKCGRSFTESELG